MSLFPSAGYMGKAVVVGKADIILDQIAHGGVRCDVGLTGIENNLN